MKRVYISIILAIWCVSATTARDRLYVDDFAISTGETKAVAIVLENDTVYCGLQTDIYLPSGLTIDMEDGEFIIDLTDRKDRTHVVSSHQQTNGAIRIFVTSQSNRPFTGNSGAIATMQVTASSDYIGGRIALKNSTVVEENGTKHTLENDPPQSDYVQGDVNMDGEVGVADITMLVSLVMGQESGANSDVNGDGETGVADITALVSILMAQ